MTVHPHAGGENYPIIEKEEFDERFTPTRVGKTSFARSHVNHHLGSPPRGWGKRFL